MAIKQSAVRYGHLPRYKVGDYINTPFSASSSAAMTIDRLDLAPLFVFKPTTIDQLSLRLFTVAASSVVRLGLFRDDGAGRPGQLVVEASATVDTSATTGARTVSCTSTLLVPGEYWIGGQAEGGAPTVGVPANNSSFAFSTSATSTGVNGVRVTHTGAFGDLTGGSFSAKIDPIIVLARIA